jgi:uncharacterized membrane protein
MSPIEPSSSRPPVVSDEQLVLIVYLLYFAAYIFGITALIGVIIAHIRFPDYSFAAITSSKSGRSGSDCFILWWGRF